VDTTGGSLVDIAFHVRPGANVSETGVQLVASVTPNGQAFSTQVDDNQGAYVLSPAPTNGPDAPSVDRLQVQTGIEVATTTTPLSVEGGTEVVASAVLVTSEPVSESTAVGPTSGSSVEGVTPGAAPDTAVPTPTLLEPVTSPSVVGSAEKPLAPSNEFATISVQAAGLGNGFGLAFPANVLTVAPAPLSGPVFSVGNVALVNSLTTGNTVQQQAADRVFLNLSGSGEETAELPVLDGLTDHASVSSTAQEQLDSLLWDSTELEADWLAR
jgi:hypothetical protein